jgi:Leucine-rich repeat (LRR) protein
MVFLFAPVKKPNYFLFFCMGLPWVSGCMAINEKLQSTHESLEKGMQAVADKTLVPVLGVVLFPLTVADAAMQKRKYNKLERRRKTAIRRAIADIVDKKVEALTSEDFESIEILVVNRSELTDLRELQNAPNLKSLHLEYNWVVDVKPLSELESLETLILGANQIIDVTALSELQNLRRLYLWDNQIKDITPLLGMKSLKVLDLEGNPVSKQDIQRLEQALPNCKIFHDHINHNPSKDKTSPYSLFGSR